MLLETDSQVNPPEGHAHTESRDRELQKSIVAIWNYLDGIMSDSVKLCPQQLQKYMAVMIARKELQATWEPGAHAIMDFRDFRVAVLQKGSIEYFSKSIFLNLLNLN